MDIRKDKGATLSRNPLFYLVGWRPCVLSCITMIFIVIFVIHFVQGSIKGPKKT